MQNTFKQFKPLQKKILVERILDKKESESGILLTMKENTNTAFGTVTHISDSVTRCKVGDVVMFESSMNNLIPVGGKLLTMMNEDDLYGLLTSGTKLDGIDNFKVLFPTDVLVQVKTVNKEVVHTSGIILTSTPSALHDRPTKGVVTQIGSGVDSLDISIGDIVEFEKTAGIDLVKDNKDESLHYVIMDAERIVGKYND